MFQLAASFLTSRAYIAMVLILLCLPTWMLLDFIALLCYKTMYTAQFLYSVQYQHPYIWTAL